MSINTGNELQSNSLRLIRLASVISATGLPRSTLYKMMKCEKFPKNVMIGERSVAWVESEIEDWIKENIKRRS